MLYRSPRVSACAPALPPSSPPCEKKNPDPLYWEAKKPEMSHQSLLVEMLNEACATRSLVCQSWFFFFIPRPPPLLLCGSFVPHKSGKITNVSLACGCMCFNTYLRNHASVSYSCLLLYAFLVWIRLVLWAEEIWGNILLEKKKWPALQKFFLLSPLLFLAMLPIYNSSPSLHLSSFSSQGWPGGFPQTKCSCGFFKYNPVLYREWVSGKTGCWFLTDSRKVPVSFHIQKIGVFFGGVSFPLHFQSNSPSWDLEARMASL